MKAKEKKMADKEMLAEYDFSGGIRGKYAKKYKEGTNLIILDPDITGYFPDSKSVNEALRGLVKIIIKRKKDITKRSTG